MNRIIFLITLLLFAAFTATASAEELTVIGETTKAVRRLASESTDLVTTPFEVSNGNILMTLGVAGATALTYAYDRDIQFKLQSNKNSSLKKATDAGSVAGDPFLHLGLAALVYGTAIAADSPKWQETGEMMGEALILADASTFLIKEAVGRGRPNATESRSDFKPLGFKKNYDSFNSMHTASSFALASVLSATSDSLTMKAAYYLAATFVGFSRMYQNKHWASDVVFGAALGELCGRVVTNYHGSNNKISLAPQAYTNGAGLALVGKW